MDEACSKEFILSLMEERDKRYAARFDAIERSTHKAETALERRFESVNEFRAQMADMQETLARRAEVDLRFDGIEKRVTDLATLMTSLKGRDTGIQMAGALVLSVITVVLAAAGVVAAVVFAK